MGIKLISIKPERSLLLFVAIKAPRCEIKLQFNWIKRMCAEPVLMSTKLHRPNDGGYIILGSSKFLFWYNNVASVFFFFSVIVFLDDFNYFLPIKLLLHKYHNIGDRIRILDAIIIRKES